MQYNYYIATVYSYLELREPATVQLIYTVDFTILEKISTCRESSRG